MLQDMATDVALPVGQGHISVLGFNCALLWAGRISVKKLCSREGIYREESVCGITDVALSGRRNGNFRMWHNCLQICLAF